MSGNNIHPGKDAYRRWIPINLVTKLENPEERTDIEEANFRAYLLEHRGEILRDLITILRAHARAGRPSGKWGLMGSFEEWDTLVRGTVHFALGIDPNKTLKAAAEESPERLEQLALLEAWKTLPGGSQLEGGLTVAQAIKFATPPPKEDVSAFPRVYDVLLRLGRDGKTVSAGSLGKKIAAMKGNVIGGLCFQQVGLVHRVALWKVVGGGNGGIGGIPPATPCEEVDLIPTSSHRY